MNQSKETWKELAKTCARSSLEKSCEQFKAEGVPLNEKQAGMLYRMLYSNIVAAWDSVATEAVAGNDVSPCVLPDPCGDCDPCCGGRPEQCAITPVPIMPPTEQTE